jgi:hypothetical protein
MNMLINMINFKGEVCPVNFMVLGFFKKKLKNIFSCGFYIYIYKIGFKKYIYLIKNIIRCILHGK